MRGLIGYSGFVGGNIAKQTQFDEFYNSVNIEDISGKRFTMLVVSGAPAAKWIANREPEKDRSNIERLIGCLDRVQADKVVLISTVDVYPNPVDVDELSPVEHTNNHAYGKNRFKLECFVAQRFPEHLTLRLPGLFGTGLKKNVIFDLINENEVHKINSEGIFQFYDVSNIWKDITRSIDLLLNLVNITTEPISVSDLAQEAFGIHFSNLLEGPAPLYNCRSIHAELFGGRNGYLYDRAWVLASMFEFVRAARSVK